MGSTILSSLLHFKVAENALGIKSAFVNKSKRKSIMTKDKGIFFAGTASIIGIPIDHDPHQNVRRYYHD